jgi:hypothetical protein
LAGQVSRENGKKGGRPPGTPWKSTLAKAEAYQLYREQVLKAMEPIVRAQVEAASGAVARVAVAELTDAGIRLRRVTTDAELSAVLDQGKYRVFLEDPDLPMARYLTDQMVGRAVEHVEVSGPNGGPIEVHDHFAVPAPGR